MVLVILNVWDSELTHNLIQNTLIIQGNGLNNLRRFLVLPTDSMHVSETQSTPPTFHGTLRLTPKSKKYKYILYIHILYAKSIL